MSARSQPGQLLFAGFEGTRVPDDLAEQVRAGRVGGVVLFARNVVDADQLRALVAELHALAPGDAPLTVPVDQEGGRVQRLRTPWTEWPPMRRLGERDDLEATREVARALGREVGDLGIDLCFAPVVDVDTNPDNPVIGDRSFSRDPAVVARHGAAFGAALQETGVAACAKHFPGHGDTALDSHFALPRVDADAERLRRVELPPFRAAIEAGVASVMTAHVVVSAVDPDAPATLSPAALSLLRNELGFDGLVFTDDTEMKAIADHVEPADMTARALRAGCDAILVCSRADLREQVLAALEALPARAVAPGLARVEAFKRRFAGGRAARDAAPPYREHLALARRVSDEAPWTG